MNISTRMVIHLPYAGIWENEGPWSTHFDEVGWSFTFIVLADNTDLLVDGNVPLSFYFQVFSRLFLLFPLEQLNYRNDRLLKGIGDF